jgi:capsular exopolysaccharide synthesis family protein
MSNADSDFSEIAGVSLASGLVHGVLQFLRVLWFRRSTVIATMVVVCLLGGLYAATATRYYESEASLLILHTGGDELVPSISVGMSHQNDIMPTYRQLVTSAIVLDGAIALLAPEHRIDFQDAPPEKWIGELSERLSARAIRRTKLIEVKYRSKDPDVAKGVTEAVVESYRNFIDNTHRGTANEIVQILRKEEIELQEKLNQKQAELLASRQSAGDIGVPSGAPVLHPIAQTAIALNDALIEAQKERMEYQSTLEAVQSAVRHGEDLQQHILAIEEAVGREILMAGLGFNTRDAHVQAEMEQSLLADRAELKTLSEHFGPGHPRFAELSDRIRTAEQYLQAYQARVSQQISDLQANQLGPMLVQMIQQALNRSWQKERSIRQSYHEAREEAIQYEGHLAKVEILEHDVARLQNLQDVLIEKIANTDLRQENGDIRATIVKHPQAVHKPVWPRLPVIGLLCLMATVVIGSAVVYIQDILDDRFRSPEELSARVGVQILAMVQRLGDRDATGLQAVEAHVAPNSPETEAFRTLRTALAFHTQESERVVISSSEPGDGKTTVMANLAVNFAQSGKKTLLIDADMRRPGLTTMLNRKGTPGLSDILHSDDDVADLADQWVLDTELEHLDVLASGPRRPNPSELLAGARMGDLLAWADAEYDQVMIDSPPVLVASDALTLGRLVDGAILVVRPDKNRRRLVSRAVDVFKSVSVPVIGVVANCVSADSGKSYGFSNYGYGYGYGGYGYGNGEENEQNWPHDSTDAPLAIDQLDFSSGASSYPDDETIVVPRRVA